MRKVRKLRHWKQRFDKNAQFIWRRPITWQGEVVEAGEVIPETLQNNPAKLKRFWEAGVIELAEFEEPDVLTGQKKEAAPAGDKEPGKTAEDLVSKEADRKWAVEGLEDTFSTKKKALEAATELLAKAEAAEDFTDKQMLVGSNVIEAEVDINGETVTLGQIVEHAFEASELSVEEWNNLEEATREDLLQKAMIDMANLEKDEEVEDEEAEDDEAEDDEAEEEAEDDEAEDDEAEEEAEDDEAEEEAEDDEAEEEAKEDDDFLN